MLNTKMTFIGKDGVLNTVRKVFNVMTLLASSFSLFFGALGMIIAFPGADEVQMTIAVVWCLGSAIALSRSVKKLRRIKKEEETERRLMTLEERKQMILEEESLVRRKAELEREISLLEHKRVKMRSTVKCPHCLANTSDKTVCEYCGSLLQS